MKKLILSLIAFSLFYSFQSCKKNEEPIVEFQTSAGNFKVKLFKETPRHRDNFTTLVKEGYYNGLIFHRVIKNHSIQTGDPNSKNASRNRLLGNGDPTYTIPAEINYPKLFHKRGMLSAVRIPDTETHNKASNGSLFSIIIGKKFTSAELDTIEIDAYNKQLEKAWQIIIAKNRSEISEISLKGDTTQSKAFQDSLVIQAEKLLNKEDVFFFTPEQRKAYTSVGGVPYMDNECTIFGEVIEGMEVAEKINALAVDGNARPIEDIQIISAKVIE